MTRGDLPPGIQCCQAVHAAFELALAHPLATGEWRAASNTLALLAAADELALARLCQDALDAGWRHARFHEPDLDGALTAAAFEPAARPLLKHLPTALTRPKEVRSALAFIFDCVSRGRILAHSDREVTLRSALAHQRPSIAAWTPGA